MFKETLTQDLKPKTLRSKIKNDDVIRIINEFVGIDKNKFQKVIKELRQKKVQNNIFIYAYYTIGVEYENDIYKEYHTLHPIILEMIETPYKNKIKLTETSQNKIKKIVSTLGYTLTRASYDDIFISNSDEQKRLFFLYQ